MKDLKALKKAFKSSTYLLETLAKEPLASRCYSEDYKALKRIHNLIENRLKAEQHSRRLKVK